MEEEIEELNSLIVELEKKNDALVRFVRALVGDAEYTLRSIGERV